MLSEAEKVQGPFAPVIRVAVEAAGCRVLAGENRYVATVLNAAAQKRSALARRLLDDLSSEAADAARSQV